MKKVEPSSDAFAQQIDQDLDQTEVEILELSTTQQVAVNEESLSIAKELVRDFRPVPQIIWRIAHFTMGRAGRINKLSDGNLFGLKKLVLAIGKDKVLGKGSSMLTTRAVVEAVPSDIIAATAVIHAVGRRLQTKEFQAVWGPILDDALMRAGIGYFVGTMVEEFGAGRGMLAGFAGRVGLALLIASGDADQAQSAIAALARGGKIEEVALELYGCEPLHVAAMLLASAGCGKDAILGVAAFTLPESQKKELSTAQSMWLSALTITEKVRAGDLAAISESDWELMGYAEEAERLELADIANTLKRRGHGLGWMI